LPHLPDPILPPTTPPPRLRLGSALYAHRQKLVAFALSLAAGYAVALQLGHGAAVHRILSEDAYECAMWLVLGIMSSVGLGTGLHTFLLYLGPHIIRVTLLAGQCTPTEFASLKVGARGEERGESEGREGEKRWQSGHASSPDILLRRTVAHECCTLLLHAGVAVRDTQHTSDIISSPLSL
jgi:hypothetical protein